MQVRSREPRLTNTTIDGLNMPAPEPGVREIRFDAMPADLVGSAGVNKTLQASPRCRTEHCPTQATMHFAHNLCAKTKMAPCHHSPGYGFGELAGSFGASIADFVTFSETCAGVGN
jgi:hypothetical protein